MATPGSMMADVKLYLWLLLEANVRSFARSLAGSSICEDVSQPIDAAMHGGTNKTANSADRCHVTRRQQKIPTVFSLSLLRKVHQFSPLTAHCCEGRKG